MNTKYFLVSICYFFLIGGMSGQNYGLSGYIGFQVSEEDFFISDLNQSLGEELNGNGLKFAAGLKFDRYLRTKNKYYFSIRSEYNYRSYTSVVRDGEYLLIGSTYYADYIDALVGFGINNLFSQEALNLGVAIYYGWGFPLYSNGEIRGYDPDLTNGEFYVGNHLQYLELDVTALKIYKDKGNLKANVSVSPYVRLYFNGVQLEQQNKKEKYLGFGMNVIVGYLKF